VVVRSFLVAGVAATVLVACGCDSSSPSANGDSTASAPTRTATATPLVPKELQGRWRLVPTSAGRVSLSIGETGYSLNGPGYRLAAGLLGDGEVLEFFPTDRTDCESAGMGRYRWALEGDTLSLALIGKDPCRSRGRVLDGSMFERMS